MNELWLELFTSLNPSDFKRIERQCTLSLSDIEQEARLLCWQICGGHTNYDGKIGSFQSYIMGKLWGLARRYPHSYQSNLPHHLDTENHDMNDHLDYLFQQHHDFTNDPLVQLIAEEDQNASEQRNFQQQKLMQLMLNDKEKNFLSLSLSLSIKELSELYLLTPRAIRYRQQNLIKKINALQLK
ncbi:MAG: hypothetical protein B7Z60_00975 [Ferrovum sp. 37-45-19]|jgi:hypothetical protein|uniref:hypothetical protein n=1 Tax=Ferrovum sp. JA12 TaxID=1356299 RepID=UPI0007024E43|nr:hypothetical protein [Ferrovum sp. JA12]OYV79926.1 MAG: hypothetical protein B7Z65_04265 [Ferrovum sp. 21-44-67]OYV95551.1 MAG: hypothetical protein B7Z60_00975 [Ferrovum sp. 37-45-19]OZB31591.1 MAG: hypothetical protein B7X47_10165 [Ferrovum sp. 34-44-207]HQT81888.1 hypothetical protein [Ferrovaceae bacterium]KRH78240.1 hypothetical protein FERRO_12210 [Ferrovum sp. JA12]